MEKNIKKLPQVGVTYNCYDDGKIRPSRHYLIKVLDVIPFDIITDPELLELIKEEQTWCDWLYSPATDYVVKAQVEGEDELQYFIRTRDGGWFSIGWMAGRLDIDHTLTDCVKFDLEKNNIKFV